jgi:DNA-binding MarR family transcriptional regulator
MTTTPVLTREIGTTERTLQAVLVRQLEGTDISFAGWVALNLAAAPEPMDRDAIIQRQVDGHLASRPEAEATLDRLQTAGLLERGAAPTLTAAGRAVFEPLRERVATISSDLFRGIEPSEIETTRAVLAEVAQRAQAFLAP